MPLRLYSRNLLTSAALCAAVFAVPAAVRAKGPAKNAAQEAAPAKAVYNKVLGAVVSIDPGGAKLTVKPDTGDNADVLLDANTSFMRVPPGEKDLKKATRIELKDISVGDRVYARSRKVEGQDATPAVSVIVMSQAEIAQHQESSRAEWQKRGSAGKVTAVDAAAKTITIGVQTPAGPKELIVQTDEKTSFRRYSPDSVKFADALPSKLADISVGDNLRVLGDRSPEGSSVHAEEIVSGTFRNIAGTVVSIDPANNEVKITDLTTKKPVTVRVNTDTNLRKLSPQMAGFVAAMRARAAGGAPGAAQGSGPGAPAGPPAMASGNPAGGPPSGGRPAWAGGAGGGPGGPGGPGGGRMDMNTMLERAPQFALADLKPGDAIVVASGNGPDPSRITAITVVAGVEPILAAASAPGAAGGQRGAAGAASALGGSWNLDIGGLPQ